jgi:hypothetical protein
MAWQYAQLTITQDTRATSGMETTQTITWHPPHQDSGVDLSAEDHTIVQLLNRFGAEGWELVAVQEHHEVLPGGRNWDAPWSRLTYTFKQQLT